MGGIFDFLNPFGTTEAKPRGNWFAENKTMLFVVLAAVNIALGLAVTMNRNKKIPLVSTLPASKSPNGK